MRDLCLPSLLAREALVEQREDLRYIELDVFEIKVFLAVFLHLEKVVELEIEL